MIRSLIKRVLGRYRMQPRVYTYKQHHIPREAISSLALKVCDRLHQHGYAAFVVGGAVRDLLLGREPKDFDIATSATPEETRELFRRSRIIGRRFQIVHVMQGYEVVEVSTFRGASNEAHTDSAGRILHDNVFGSQAEDAVRRDFTVNALYYNPRAEEVVDYHNGLADIEAQRLVLIGEPEQRFREDPVRMLRAVRLAGKLDLAIDSAILNVLPRSSHLLHQVPAARLLDEFMKILECGASWRIVDQLDRTGLLPDFMPVLAKLMENRDYADFIRLSLQATDRRIADGKSISLGYVFAAILWPRVLELWRKAESDGEKVWPALFGAIETVLEDGDQRMGIPRRHTAFMREIWTMQPRFEQRAGQRASRMLEHERFRAAYDFLCLRVEAGEGDAELASWWTRFIASDEDGRHNLLDEVVGVKPAASKRKRRRRRSDNAQGSEHEV